jgi:hypothetical protein
MALVFCLMMAWFGAGPEGTEHSMTTKDLVGFNGWLDRIEGDQAVLLPDNDGEEGEELVVPVTSLPRGAKEGVRLTNGKVDRRTTRQTAARMKSLMEDLVKLGEGKP